MTFVSRVQAAGERRAEWSCSWRVFYAADGSHRRDEQSDVSWLLLGLLTHGQDGCRRDVRNG